MYKFGVALLSFVLGFFAGADEAGLSACVHYICPLLNETSLRFMMLGDWGGLPVWPYITPAQQNVAKGMAKMGDSAKTHFQLALGDNIYIVGVKTPDDSRFQKTFESVYDDGDALYKPWYLIAGNHDHYGDVAAQISYSQKSKRWVFPDYYYTIRYRLANDIRIDIIMIDTIILCGNTREGKYSNFYDYLTAPASDRKTQGPSDPEAAEKQWHWIEDQLQNSSANYLFVAGHYPVFSIAEHGPTQCLVDRLRPMLRKYKVNAYFCGHDHSLQHLNETDETGWPIHYILSGSGAYEIKSNKSLPLVPPGSTSFYYPSKSTWSDVAAKVGLGKGGFVYAEVGQKEAKFSYLLSNLSPLHEFTLTPRR